MEERGVRHGTAGQPELHIARIEGAADNAPQAATVHLIFGDALTQAAVTQLGAAGRFHVEVHGTLQDYLASRRATDLGCLILDITFRQQGGLEMLREFRDQGIWPPVVVVSQQATAGLAVEAMQAGALTLLTVPCGASTLESAIELALKRDRQQHLQRQQREEIRAGLKRLSQGEHDVLERLLAGRQNKQIAADLDIGLRTVELRRATILKKLHADSLATLVRMVVFARQMDWPPAGAGRNGAAYRHNPGHVRALENHFTRASGSRSVSGS